MRLPRIAMPAALAASLVALPLSVATAQPYYGYRPWCNPFPLTWPFCVVGAAGWVVTAPFRAIAHPYYYPPPPPPPYYGYGPGYSPYYR